MASGAGERTVGVEYHIFVNSFEGGMSEKQTPENGKAPGGPILTSVSAEDLAGDNQLRKQCHFESANSLM